MRARDQAFFSMLAAMLLAFAFTAEVQAGKLGRARAAVRSAPAPQAAEPPKPKAEKQSKLKQARRATRQASARPAVPRPPRRRRGGHGHGHYCPPPIFWGQPSHTTYVYQAPPVYQPVAPQFVAPQPVAPSEPHVQLEGPQLHAEPELETCFALFPYAGGAGGFLDLQPAGFAKPWMANVRFELGTDFDGLSRQGASITAESISGLGLDFHWDAYRESLPGGGYDELHIGDLNAMWRVVQTDHSLVRVGLGVNWLGDAVDTNAGLNLTMKADFAPIRPVVFSTELDFGTMGDAEMLHGAATVGIVTDRFELFGGYDYRRIGQAELQGPMIGLRLWF